MRGGGNGWLGLSVCYPEYAAGAWRGGRRHSQKRSSPLELAPVLHGVLRKQDAPPSGGASRCAEDAYPALSERNMNMHAYLCARVFHSFRANALYVCIACLIIEKTFRRTMRGTWSITSIVSIHHVWQQRRLTPRRQPRRPLIAKPRRRRPIARSLRRPRRRLIARLRRRPRTARLRRRAVAANSRVFLGNAPLSQRGVSFARMA